MAVSIPSEEERNANLDALESAVTEWAEREVNRLDKETQFLRSVLTGRGVTELGTSNLSATSSLLQSEINQFLNFR